MTKSINIIILKYSDCRRKGDYRCVSKHILRIHVGSLKEITKENLRFAQLLGVIPDSATADTMRDILMQYSNESSIWTYKEHAIKIERYSTMYPRDYIVINKEEW